MQKWTTVCRTGGAVGLQRGTFTTRVMVITRFRIRVRIRVKVRARLGAPLLVNGDGIDDGWSHS